MENTLHHIKEFEKLLKTYKPSDETKKILARTKLVLLIGPFASGRNTVINGLLKEGEYQYIISDTTRQPRYNRGKLEQSGREYWFVTEEEMLEGLKTGKLLEAEVLHGQQVSGVSIREIEKAVDTHKIAITDVDIAGVDNILKLKPDTQIILLLPPDFEEWQRRVNERGTMPDGEYVRRMNTASRIFALAKAEPDKYVAVVNNDLDSTVEMVGKISHGYKLSTIELEETAHVLDDLAKNTKQSLTKFS